MAFDTFELNDFNWNLGGKKFLHIFFFGDTHDCAEDSDDDYIQELRRQSEKSPYECSLFLGIGDYGDFASTSERRSINHAGLHDTTIAKLDREAHDDLNKRVKSLEFMRGRLIGLHNGNHDWCMSNGKYASEILAERLGCRHLGYSAHSRIAVKQIFPRGGTCSLITIFSSHGKGSGKLLGSPWNSLEQMSRIINNADLYAMGHDHSLGSIPDTRLEVVYNNKSKQSELKMVKRLFIRTGSSLRGYVPGKRSYISKALYKPCSLGFPQAIVSWKRSYDGGKDVLVKDIHSFV